MHSCWEPQLWTCGSHVSTRGVCLQDIPAAFGEQRGALWNHFVHYGQHEGRPYLFTCGRMGRVVSTRSH